MWVIVHDCGGVIHMHARAARYIIIIIIYYTTRAAHSSHCVARETRARGNGAAKHDYRLHQGDKISARKIDKPRTSQKGIFTREGGTSYKGGSSSIVNRPVGQTTSLRNPRVLIKQINCSSAHRRPRRAVDAKCTNTPFPGLVIAGPDGQHPVMYNTRVHTSRVARDVIWRKRGEAAGVVRKRYTRSRRRGRGGHRVLGGRQKGSEKKTRLGAGKFTRPTGRPPA